MKRQHLKPGDMFFGQDTLVETLLGSCVSITLWFPKAKMGGMCHLMLPSRPSSRAAPPKLALDGRYGDEAWRWLNQQVRANLLNIEDAQVKLFGGSKALLNGQSDVRDIGKKNIEFAQACLDAAGLKLIARDVGGAGYRVLKFDLTNGDIWLRRGSGLIDAEPRERHT